MEIEKYVFGVKMAGSQHSEIVVAVLSRSVQNSHLPVSLPDVTARVAVVPLCNER
jgi:hypothetical protein